MRFGASSGYFLSGSSTQISVVSPNYQTNLGFVLSTSNYKTTNAYACEFSTTSELFKFSKYLEAKDSIGIDGSATRLINNSLIFSSSLYLVAVSGVIQHNGNATFSGNISSVKFVSGFAGEGWAITKNTGTGSILATFDELTIRKKMRVYELEVQIETGTNGALWVSDSCKADRVEKIN